MIQRKLLPLFFTGLCLFMLGCSKQDKKNSDEMKFVELKKQALTHLDKGNKRDAVFFLEKMVAHHSDNQHVGLYKLMLADLYFKMSRHIQSYEMYQHFHELYPADQKAEYASYKAILSKYYQTLRTDCDSTATEQTLRLCKGHLQNPTYINYQKDVSDIENTCRKKIVDKEVYVYNFYLREGKVQSARNRLKYLREEHLPKSVSLEPRLLYLESKLAKHEKNLDLMQEKMKHLAVSYPNSQYTRMARGLSQRARRFF